MKKYSEGWVLLADIIFFLFIYPIGNMLKFIRIQGVSKMPRCKRALMEVGIFPLLNQYYEPLFDMRQLTRPLDQDRDLPGIDWNVSGQLNILGSFDYNEELKGIPRKKVDEGHFYMDNGNFESGDAEYWYNIIRSRKPARILEIGSGHSTLLARKAIQENQKESAGYSCKHVCIEPYEMPWLEKIGVSVIRRKVEEVDKAVFAELSKGDILFIDSSHIIRPQGDVLFEYLELLPSLNVGVMVHVHDIFSPKDYPKEWIEDEFRFWNEQYLLEAFLSCNRDWKIMGALNYLQHKHFERLKEKSPFLTQDREPGSFYIEKIA